MRLDGEIAKTGIMPAVVVPAAVASGKPKKLFEEMRDVLRVKHYSLRTERSYCDWVKRFIRFHGLRHPKEMNAREISQFLTHLARIGNVSAGTQNQALSALLFLYQHDDDLHARAQQAGNRCEKSAGPRLICCLPCIRWGSSAQSFDVAQII